MQLTIKKEYLDPKTCIKTEKGLSTNPLLVINSTNFLVLLQVN